MILLSCDRACFPAVQDHPELLAAASARDVGGAHQGGVKQLVGQGHTLGLAVLIDEQLAQIPHGAGKNQAGVMDLGDIARPYVLAIERVDVAPDGISVTLHAAGIRSLVAELADRWGVDHHPRTRVWFEMD